MVITGWVPSPAPQSGWVSGWAADAYHCVAVGDSSHSHMTGDTLIHAAAVFISKPKAKRRLVDRLKSTNDPVSRPCSDRLTLSVMSLSLPAFVLLQRCCCISHMPVKLLFQKPHGRKIKNLDGCRPQKIVQNKHFQVNGCFFFFLCVWSKSANENHFRRRQLIR